MASTEQILGLTKLFNEAFLRYEQNSIHNECFHTTFLDFLKCQWTEADDVLAILEELFKTDAEIEAERLKKCGIRIV